MAWNYQKARWGYHELLVWKQHEKWVYVINWHTDTAITTVGRGSQQYSELHEVREAAVLHLANILPQAQSNRLMLEQSELEWEPWSELRQRHLKR
jgi:hypothetical protein